MSGIILFEIDGFLSIVYQQQVMQQASKQVQSPQRVQLTQDISYQNKQIGKGTYGKVYKGFINSMDIDVAVKKIILSSEEIYKLLEKEILAMSSVKHANIVKYYTCIPKIENHECYIVLEYCSGGTLHQLIKKKGKLSDDICLRYLKQIVDAISNIHQARFIHRDLKTENILLASNYSLKICDFGIARKLDSDLINVQQNMTNNRGTPYYMAPQVWQTGKYCEKCDVWSIGVILYEMCTGTNPFSHLKIYKDYYRQYDIIKTKRYKELKGEYNNFLKSIVRRTFVYDQEDRIDMETLKKLVDDEYYSKMNKNMPQQSTGIISRKIKIVNYAVIQKKNVSQNLILPKNAPPIKNAKSQDESIYHNQVSNEYMRKLFVHIQFLRNKSYEFVKLSEQNRKLQMSKSNKSEKYIGLAIAIAIFHKSIQQALQTMMCETINIDNETSFTLSKLQQQNQNQLINQRKKYAEYQIKFDQTLLLIHQKLNKQPYTTQFKSTLFNFRNVLRQLQMFVKLKKFSKSKDWFQSWYQMLYMQYNILDEEELKKIDKDYLRVYWGCIKLSDSKHQFPTQNKSQNIIQKFQKDFKLKSESQMIEQITKIRERYLKQTSSLELQSFSQLMCKKL